MSVQLLGWLFRGCGRSDSRTLQITSNAKKTEVTDMPKPGEADKKRSQPKRSARTKPSKNCRVAVMHYPDERTIRIWRETMSPGEFARAVAAYSRLVEE
jgi:hypothetical protein